MIIYDSIYALVEKYIFGSIEVGSYQELVCIAVSTVFSIFVIALPFLVVWRIIRIFI